MFRTNPGLMVVQVGTAITLIGRLAPSFSFNAGSQRYTANERALHRQEKVHLWHTVGNKQRRQQRTWLELSSGEFPGRRAKAPSRCAAVERRTPPRLAWRADISVRGRLTALCWRRLITPGAAVTGGTMPSAQRLAAAVVGDFADAGLRSTAPCGISGRIVYLTDIVASSLGWGKAAGWPKAMQHQLLLRQRPAGS